MAQTDETMRKQLFDYCEGNGRHHQSTLPVGFPAADFDAPPVNQATGPSCSPHLAQPHAN